MATNLTLELGLLDEVLRASSEKTKKAAVTLALKEFIARRRRKRIRALFGKLEWDAGYDDEKERKRRRR